MPPKNRKQIQDDINAGLDSTSDIAKGLSNVLEKELKTRKRLNQTIRDDVETLNLLVKTEESNLSLKEKIFNLTDKTKGLNEDILKTEKKRYQTTLAATDAVQKQAGAMMDGIRGIVRTVEKLPGGGLLTAKLGFGQQNLSDMQDNLSKVIATGGDMSEVFQGVEGASTKTALRLVSIAATIGIVMGLWKAFSSILKSFSEVLDKAGQTFGAMGAQDLGKPLYDAKIQAIALGKSVDDILTITKSLSTEFGFGVKESLDLSNQILDSSVAMGLTADQGAKLFGTLIKIGGLTADQAEYLAESTYSLARANDINPAAAMEQIAENSELFATYSKDGGKNIALAAVQATKLGVSLSSMQQISDSLLDFQTSLNSEIEAGILLGRDINLQKARELALTDDMSGMMDEVLKQLGGEAEWQELLGYQRKALASALGTDVATMAKLVANQGKLTEQTKGFAQLLGKDALASLTIIVNKFKTIGAEIVKRVVPNLQIMVGDFERFLSHGGWERIKNSLLSIAGVLKFMVEHPAAIGALLGFSAGSTFGLKGAAIGGVLGALGFGMMGLANGGSFVTSGPTPIMVGDNTGGKELVTAMPLGGGGRMPMDTTPIAREVSSLKSEMTALRSDMKSYFGFGGSAPKQFGRETVRGLETANSRV